MKLCICGGGGLGHVIAGVAASRGTEVRLFSPRAEQWESEIEIYACDGEIFRGNVAKKSSDAGEIVPGSDAVLLCVPGYLIRPTLEKIRPFLSENTLVGSVVSSSGFFFAAQEILPVGTLLFGFQRVPYVARVESYGKSANILGFKKELQIATDNLSDDARERLRTQFENIFATPTRLLKSFWDAALTNSNPLLHPCRLYGMWKSWDGKTPYATQPGFYEDWDDFSSETLLAADEDFFRVIEKLPVTPGAIPRLRDYYESPDVPALTSKLKSIAAFKGILLPMIALPSGGFFPDVGNRYFTEDIPFGMKIIKQLADEHGVKTPTIDAVLNWAENLPPPQYATKCLKNESGLG